MADTARNAPTAASHIASVEGSMMSMRAASILTNAMRYKSAAGGGGQSTARISQQGKVVQTKEEGTTEMRWRIGKLDTRYECKHCETYLKYPVQFQDCRHRVCSTCLTDILQQDACCPQCQLPIKRENISIDHEFQKEIHNIPVFCNNRTIGCQWEGNFKEHLTHQEECEYTDGDILCEFCKRLIRKQEELAHYDMCQKFLVPCPAGCGLRELQREKVQEHLDNVCSKNEITCPFLDCGCAFKSKRVDMPKHLREAPGIHLNLMCKQLALQKSQIQIMTEIVDKQKDQLSELAVKAETVYRNTACQLIWKIDAYTEKFAEAKAGKKGNIFSPPFMSSRYGYKLALSASLFGDGKARGKFMSLFCCICKGEYDTLQSWPFNQRITLTLLDQNDDVKQRKHVTYTIKPNTCKENLAFLGRPNNDRNASFGSQRFIELHLIGDNDYIVNDSIFIKVEIESAETQAY